MKKYWMKNIILSCACVLFLHDFAVAQTAQTDMPVKIGVSVRTVGIEYIETLLKNATDSVLVLNFWATWCKPCVEELPHFERFRTEYAGRKVRVVLVSLDFKKDASTKLEPFVKRQGLRSEVVHLSAGNPNDWISRINESWSGAIPATVVVAPKATKRLFHEGAVKYADIENFVKPLLGE